MDEYGDDPIFTEDEVTGFYPLDEAAIAAKYTRTDLGSGNWRTDD